METPPKLTVEALKKCVPRMMTVSPGRADVGLKLPIIGGGGTLYKNPASEAVPRGVVTLTAPEAPVPTRAVMTVSEATVKPSAETLPKRTTETPVKPVPTKRYCTPVKDGEYWALGLPVIITEGISDDSGIIRENGIVGDGTRSTPELGKRLLDLKVDYAVRQIRGFLGQ